MCGAGCVEPFEREGRPSTVAEQPFDAGSVLALDADGRIDAEPAGAAPREHAVGIGFVEQAMRHGRGAQSAALLERELPHLRRFSLSVLRDAQHPSVSTDEAV